MSSPQKAARRPGASVDPAVVLTKATVRASDLLGLSRAALARVTGASEATVSRWANGQRALELRSKEAELAALLVRVYRSLDALVGNDDEQRRAWMAARNRALSGVPRELVLSSQGLVQVLQYVDGMRAVV